ncbi:cytochrome c oxidase subunit II [Almyronema epifaneia]|uniref:Cytochrome c oxidase subunit 2 n=1 Tax=Almyronema epifaneia S1 TaxID=2991925 RepID=A0ABW6ID05_9CYAN
MKIPSSILTMLAGIFLTLASLWYGQNHGLLPVAASAEAELVDGLFNTMMTISVGLFLLVEGALIFAAIRFRRRKGDEGDGEHIEGNIPLEILWTAIPAVIVFGISVYSFDVYTRLGGLTPMVEGTEQTIEVAYAGDDASLPMLGVPQKAAQLASNLGIGSSPELQGRAPDVSVNVMAVQYAFVFTYPDSGVVSGELHVPVNNSVRLNLQAQDVLHAFWLPELRIKQDVIPGTETELAFTPTRVGTYPVICAELCGPYHGAMKTQLIVQSAEDYGAWVQSQVAQSQGSDAIASLPTSDRSDTAYLETLATPHDLKVDTAALSHLSHHHALASVAADTF